jgi:hypothetical protein
MAKPKGNARPLSACFHAPSLIMSSSSPFSSKGFAFVEFTWFKTLAICSYMSDAVAAGMPVISHLPRHFTPAVLPSRSIRPPDRSYLTLNEKGPDLVVGP